MAIKSNADLTTQNTTVIASQTAPDTITPTTLAAHLKDVIDSMINQIDQLINGTALTTIINNAVSAALTGITLNGLPGQFAVALGSEYNYSDSLVNARRQIKLLNENDNGCFDNGGNYNGGKYIVPVGGFTGKFEITDLDIEAVTPPNTNQTYTIEINEYDAVGVHSAVLASTTVTIPSAAAAGDLLAVVSVQSASATFAAGRIISADIKNSTAVSTAGVIKIKSMLFNNLAV
jgi:hypothetical protein